MWAGSLKCVVGEDKGTIYASRTISRRSASDAHKGEAHLRNY